jgi:hypothetical protein
LINFIDFDRFWTFCSSKMVKENSWEIHVWTKNPR